MGWRFVLDRSFLHFLPFAFLGCCSCVFPKAFIFSVATRGDDSSRLKQSADLPTWQHDSDTHPAPKNEPTRILFQKRFPPALSYQPLDKHHGAPVIHTNLAPGSQTNPRSTCAATSRTASNGSRTCRRQARCEYHTSAGKAGDEMPWSSRAACRADDGGAMPADWHTRERTSASTAARCERVRGASYAASSGSLSAAGGNEAAAAAAAAPGSASVKWACSRA